MESINKYKVGDWIKETGKYLNLCIECQDEFKGRRNQTYCSPKCKSKHNNDLRRMRGSEIKTRMASYQKSADVLQQCHDPSKNITTVNRNFLINMGFKINSPTTRIKFNNLEGEWYQIGAYAYQITANQESVQILKVKP